MLTTIVDQKYLFEEAKYLIKSCMKYMPDEKFVLNLVNVDQSVDREVKSWHNNIIIRHLSLEIPKERYGAYMYCAMSFPLYDILTEFNEPLIYLDADMVLMGGLDEIINDLSNYDLMIRYIPFQDRKGPTTLKDGAKVNNGTTAIAPSTGGTLFAKKFRDKVLDYLDGGLDPIYWHEDIKVRTCIDQEFIYVTMKELEKKNKLKFFPLNDKFNDSYFLDSSLVWHAKGSSRTHPKYLMEIAKYDGNKLSEIYLYGYITFINLKNKMKQITKQLINRFHREQSKKLFKKLMNKMHVKDILAINCDLEDLNLDKEKKVKIKAFFFDPVLYYKYKDKANVDIEYKDPNGFSGIKLSNEFSYFISIFGKKSVNNTQLDVNNIIRQCKVFFVHNENSLDRNLINDYKYYKTILNYKIFIK